jgi:plasmid stabilization system protein ParE
MNCVENKLQRISEHPEYYGKRKANYRNAKVEDFPYFIIYEFFVRRKIIHIVAIYHGKRNPKSKFRKIK